MRTLLTKMFRTTKPAPIRKTVMNIVALEDRSVPAAFTFGGTAFDTNDQPSQYVGLATGTYDGAVITGTPTTPIAVGIGFPDQVASFPSISAIGNALFPGNGAAATGDAKALNLPAGNNGFAARSGYTALYQNGAAIANAAGADIIIYESASSATVVEAMMIQAYNVNTGQWSPWVYQQPDSFALYVGDATQGAYSYKYDLSNLGFAATDYATKFRVVNMTDADRMATSANGGVVIAGDNGVTSAIRPAPGPLAGGATSYNSGTYDPDPLYMGALGSIATNIVNVKTVVTAVPTPGVSGTDVTYTVTITNLGSGQANGVAPTFTLDPNFTPSSITSTNAGGATGNTNTPNTDVLTLPESGTVTYTIVGNVSSAASGTLTSTFNGGTPALPAVDPNPADNTAVSNLPLTQSANVTVTITPGDGDAPAGAPITYTVTVTNGGPSGVNGVGITDVIPPGLTGVTYTSTTTGGATGNTPNGNGAINDTANLPAGSTVVYTVTGSIPPTFSGNIPFQGTATLPSGTTNTDPNGGTKTVNTNAVLTGDLFVTMTATPPTPISGTAVTYTIVANNKGPSTATASLLTDSFSSAYQSVTFTSVASGGATGNTNGNGDLSQALTLPSGSKVTYTVTAIVGSNSTGLITNSATLEAPANFTDPDLSNNTATASVTAQPGADVGLTITPNTSVASLGGPMKYTVEVTNKGPAAANGVSVASLLDSNILGVTFTSVASNGGNGNTSAGNGNINDLVNIPVGGKITYVIGGTVKTGISGNLVSNFTANSPIADPNTGDNSVTITTPTQPSPKVIYAASTGLGVVTQVFVFNADGSQRFSYQPYATAFTRGVNVGIGDVNGDGFPDVVTGAASGGGSHVKAVNGLDGSNLFSFFAYGSTVRTGVVVTVNDINGDGLSEIITGSDAGGGPRIRVFDMKQGGSSGNSILDFFAFDPSVNTGVRVASGNITGDAKSEIIVSAGPGTSTTPPSQLGAISFVKIFNGATGAFISQFQPFGNSTLGSYVAAADFNSNGFADIVVGIDRGTTPTVAVFDPQQGNKLTSSFLAYETNFKGGVRVATYNDDSVSVANPPARILTGPGIGGGPRLRKFTGTGGDLGSQFLIGSFDRGGIYVG
ncbi:hypothetical protein BH11PLA2_BH11PLA2_13310 [soil metagenome]